MAVIKKKEQDDACFGNCSSSLGNAFFEATGTMEELLGPDCYLKQQLMTASLEKLETDLGKMKSLGASYKQLTKQIGLVDKSLVELDQFKQAVKIEECAKLFLACQSGRVA